MNRTAAVSGTIVLTLTAVLLCPARADDAKTRFTALYGRDLLAVRQTATFEDDLKLASAMLDTAKATRDDDQLLAELCGNVYLLTSRRNDGHALAIDAMDLLGATIPARAADCQEKTIPLYRARYGSARRDLRAQRGQELINAMEELADLHLDEKDYAEATNALRQALTAARSLRSSDKDELEARYKQVLSLQQSTLLAASLAESVRKDPTNFTAREKLIEVYLSRLDDPNAAMAYLAPSSPIALRTYVPLAAKDPAKLDKAVLLQLANWYRSMTRIGPDEEKIVLLRRARRYYEAFLRRHRVQDAQKTKVAFDLKTVNDAIAKLDPTDSKAWQDLLKRMDPKTHTVDGTWTQAPEGGLTGTAPQRVLLAMRLRPTGGYQVQLRFTAKANTPRAEMLLPVGRGGARVSLGGDDGQTVQLHFSQQPKLPPAALRGSKGRFRFLKGQVYTAVITVEPRDDVLKVSATVNGRSMIQWRGAKGDLGTGWRLRYAAYNTLVVGATGGEITLSDLRIRSTDGTLRISKNQAGLKETLRWRSPRRPRRRPRGKR